MTATARSQSTDPFLMNRFHVVDTDGFLNLGTPAAGFNTCTMPEMTVESHEYKEGLWTYKRKFAGDTTFNDITLTKGVVKNDTTFFRWVLAASQGYAYRTNLVIKHFHRDDITGLLDYTNAKPYREIIIYNAFPITTKLGSDLDAMSSDISIEEIVLTYELFTLKINGTEQTPLGKS